MEAIVNEKLSNLLNKTICVDSETGMIMILNDNDSKIDITNDILEVVTIAIEDSHTFVGLNRIIKITVEDITKEQL